MAAKSRYQLAVVLAAVFCLTAVVVAVAGAHPEGPSHHAPMPPHATEVMRNFAADAQPAVAASAVGPAACDSETGQAAGYPCRNVDLLSYLPLSEIGGTRSNSAANDIWGWTDPATGKEYAIIGRVFGTSFVDISTPTAPVYLGELPTHGAFGSSWRDIKVVDDHAFIVSEALNHGMQVFDLRQLRNVTGPPVTFSETAHYNQMASAHNIAINEDSKFAYIVGASGKNSCSGGLHMVDLANPTSPTFAGCFSTDGYTHDTQCVTYNGPDSTRLGREICLNSNEDTITIVDVTDKSNPEQLARMGYDGSAYTHQGWLTEDHATFVLDDELDERDFAHGTRTRVWDVSELTSPKLVSYFTSFSTAIDHNQYIIGNHSYQANYRAGLRVLDISNLSDLREIAYFDVYPADDAPEFNGAWSNYPYFRDGVVVVSGIEQGLFVLRTNLTGATGTGGTTTVVSGDPGTEPQAIHVGDLDGSSSARGKRWTANVTITVHDGAEAPLAGVTVAGTWTPGSTGATCETGTAGSCTVSLGRIDQSVSSVSFTVDSLSKAGYAYGVSANHDPDGDSDGTTIVVARP